MATKIDSGLVVHDGGLVKDVLDNAKPLANYTALRAYTGSATGVRITTPGIAGFFQRLGTAGLADDGGTVIIDALGRAWERLLSDHVSAFWFMTPAQIADVSGNIGALDVTSPVQSALNHKLRKTYMPDGKYRITSSLYLKQAATVFGTGVIQDPNDGGLTTVIVADGDFDAFVIPSGSYYGWSHISRLYIKKTGGTAKSNSGIKSSSWAPHVIIEQIVAEGFNVGIDLYAGLSQLNSVNARFNNIGFSLHGTSFVVQNCYANRGVTGYRVTDQTTYVNFISCASDGNTDNAYELTGTTGPFTTSFLSTNSQVTFQSCGAENCGRYLYVDGQFDVSVSNPTVHEIQKKPVFAHIESAVRVRLSGLEKIGATDWLYVNKAKCTSDVVVIEGDFPSQNQVSPVTPTYNLVPAAVIGVKQSFGMFELAKTRVPNIALSPKQSIAGAGAGQQSYMYKGVFASQSLSTNRVRFRVKVLSNGFSSTLHARVSQFGYISGSGDAGGEIYFSAANTGGVGTVGKTTLSGATFFGASAPSPDGYTYRYLFVELPNNIAHLFDVTAYTNFELFQADMFTGYKNWTVTNAEATTTGGITSGTATLTVSSGVGITDGMQIVVNGAGTAGSSFVTTVVSGGGTTTLTLAANAATTVSSAAVSAYTL